MINATISGARGVQLGEFEHFGGKHTIVMAMELLSTLPRKLMTLAFVVRPQQHTTAAISTTTPVSDAFQVLLGEKKRGFGQGKWNGFGGKVDPTDASVMAAAAREIQEEANVLVQLQDLEHRGVLTFSFEGAKEILEVHVYLTTNFTGEPTESEEMKPKWYNFDAIPFSQMWSDDHIWLPHVLSGKCVHGHFHFSKDEDTLLEHNLTVSDTMTTAGLGDQ